MNRRFFFPIILVGLLALSFTVPTHERVDPGIYLEVEGLESASDSFTLSEGVGVVCGGGYGSACEVYLTISLYEGNYPDLYWVRIYRNGSQILDTDISPSGFYGTYFSYTFTGRAGDTFYATVDGLISTGKSKQGGNDDAVLTLGMGI